MSYTPSVNPQPTQKNNSLVGILLVALLAAIGYIIYDKTQDKKVEVLSQKKDEVIQNLDSAKTELQLMFDDASSRIDSISTTNVQLQGDLATRNAEIVKMKQSIGSILKKKNATDQELKDAKDMISQLNGKIDDLFVEVAKLKGENEKLTGENVALSNEKNSLIGEKKNLETNLATKESENANLNEKVDVASTLHASQVAIYAIKKRGDKEKETETAKRADFFRVAFQLDENRVAKAGVKTIYVIVKNIDGTTSMPDGSFSLRDGKTLQYTNKVDVTYDPSKANNVSFNWEPGDKFAPGDYKIEIYNNGFKIGEAVKTLKKGGLFS